MNINTTRKAAAGFFALAALGLGACSPPHQVDSGNKVDTATSQNPDSLPGAGVETSTGVAPTNVADAAEATATTTAAAEGELPLYIACGRAEDNTIERIVLACEEQNDFIENIEWSEWTGTLASGVGTRVTVDPERRVENTQIQLGNPQRVNGTLQFTTVTVDGLEINPDSTY